MVAWTLLGLVLLTFFGLGLRRDALFLLIAVITTVFAAFGIAGAFGLEFNFMNSIVVPIWLGLGIDSFYHLVIHQRTAPGDIEGLISVLKAVGAAIGTSLIGFGALMASHHTGLQSLAVIGVLGLASIFVMTVVVAVTFFVRPERT